MNQAYEKVVEQLYQKKDIGLSDLQGRLEINSTQGSFDYLGQIEKTLNLGKELTLLDIGCGTGKHLKLLQNKYDLNTLGCDPSIEDHTDAKVKFKKAKASVLPYADHTADRIMCNYALYYEFDWQAAISEMLRVSKDKGLILITGPASDNNDEFYSFHKDLFGDISEIDKLGLNFLDQTLTPFLKEQQINFIAEKFTNAVTFNGEEDFIKYYCATSLFRMTCQKHTSEEIVKKINEASKKHFENNSNFINTKKIRFIVLEVS